MPGNGEDDLPRPSIETAYSYQYVSQDALDSSSEPFKRAVNRAKIVFEALVSAADARAGGAAATPTALAAAAEVCGSPDKLLEAMVQLQQEDSKSTTPAGIAKNGGTAASPSPPHSMSNLKACAPDIDESMLTQEFATADACDAAASPESDPNEQEMQRSALRRAAVHMATAGTALSNPVVSSDSEDDELLINLRRCTSTDANKAPPTRPSAGNSNSAKRSGEATSSLADRIKTGNKRGAMKVSASHETLKIEPPRAPATEVCKSILADLKKDKRAAPFLEPIDPGLITDYLSVVEEPMDLGTITTRLDGAAYTIDAFAADVRLVFSNADAYCTSRYPMIANAAAALSKKFETALKKKLINADVRTGKTARCAAKKAPSPDEPVYTSDVDFAIAPPGAASGRPGESPVDRARRFAAAAGARLAREPYKGATGDDEPLPDQADAAAAPVLEDTIGRPLQEIAMDMQATANLVEQNGSAPAPTPASAQPTPVSVLADQHTPALSPAPEIPGIATKVIGGSRYRKMAGQLRASAAPVVPPPPPPSPGGPATDTHGLTQARLALSETDAAIAAIRESLSEQRPAVSSASVPPSGIVDRLAQAEKELKKASTVQGEKKRALDQARDAATRAEESVSAKRIKLEGILNDPDLADIDIHTAVQAQLDALSETCSARERAVKAAVEDEAGATDDMRAREAEWRAILDDE